MHTRQPVRMEFHISREARDRYKFDQELFSLSGNLVFANFHAARVFAKKINDRRDLVNFPERAVRAGQINAMGLIDEILHFVVAQYRQEIDPIIMDQALAWLYERIGKEAIDDSLKQFAQEFPPVGVYNQSLSLEEYLEGRSSLPDGRQIPNRQIVLEEMLLLWLANVNPAFSPFMELFDDSRLEKTSAYAEIVDSLRDFFELKPPYGPENQNLIDMLRSPAVAVPHSLSGQLEYIRTRWGYLIGKYLYRLLSSLDLIREEEKAMMLGPGPSIPYEFTGLELEAERFSQDKEWMPRLVLIAKNSYVWLDQLSKKYERSITRLDQIPEQELETLARWGITGLWLIGLWERSPASKRIKQLRGNLDAVASAYSLFNYDIAGDLGGDEAYASLKDKAWKYGIRLASDMVPNHMGIDSPWVIEHPDWFISLDYSPFPSYTFNGPNLSWDERVGIYLEDHYYDNTDAAVVFKRVDFWSGSEKYIYHGNDGTSMPWNDTAQLNYLLPQVREAVIQTILHVARKFPVIRFDAAMTLAKKHFQRLWYPEPGSGGDIPSRAEHSMTREEFNQAFPEEFWREVVDRVAQEVPDTLLLAEAFWLMEGYFVRTLGMHRVYNSAFMNMLRDEKNQEYRLVIKNTLEFEPEILKRYVNFMNNPDERTAVDQFGKGDKYFGISTLLATMPGLPMFGHGQVEGYSEKYGMEFRRAYWDERPDPYLVERHERQIFPLLRRRYLFAEVHNFLLYDFFTPEGYVNEDVFAYSNRHGDDRALILYNNKFNTTRGWIHTSTAYPEKTSKGERLLQQKSLGAGLNLRNEPDYFTIFRNHVDGLEYIRSNRELHEKGLFAELKAYQCMVLLDFRQVHDDEWRQYSHLEGFLNGRGVPSIDEALKEIFLQPIHRPFRELVNAGFMNWLMENRLMDTDDGFDDENLGKALKEANQKTTRLYREVISLSEGSGDPQKIAGEVMNELRVSLSLPIFDQQYPLIAATRYRTMLKFLQSKLDGAGEDRSPEMIWGTLFGYLFTHRLAEGLGEDQTQAEIASQSRSWIDEWLLGKIIAAAIQDMGVPEDQAWRCVAVIKWLTSHQDWYDASIPAEILAYQLVQRLLRDADIQNFIGVNRYQGTLWFNKESFEELLWWLFTQTTIGMAVEADFTGKDKEKALVRTALDCYQVIRILRDAKEESNYQVEKLLESVEV